MTDCQQPKLGQCSGAGTWLRTNLPNTYRWQLMCRNHYTLTSRTRRKTLKQVQRQEGQSFPFCRGFYLMYKELARHGAECGAAVLHRAGSPDQQQMEPGHSSRSRNDALPSTLPLTDSFDRQKWRIGLFWHSKIVFNCVVPRRKNPVASFRYATNLTPKFNSFATPAQQSWHKKFRLLR